MSTVARAIRRWASRSARLSTVIDGLPCRVAGRRSTRAAGMSRPPFADQIARQGVDGRVTVEDLRIQQAVEPATQVANHPDGARRVEAVGRQGLPGVDLPRVDLQ